jgi:leucyl/phenylalanyl-tRNA--protein transferase
MNQEIITPHMVLDAYAQGYFPMAQRQEDEQLYWFCPQWRGVIALDSRFHLSRSNARLMRQHRFTLTLNQAFEEVMLGCRERREGSWINQPILTLYAELHRMGYGHSVECWQGEKLVGGIYGLALGGAFFGESMFSRESGASKVALITLRRMLINAGYVLFDTQYVNDHLRQFGVLEVPRGVYLDDLRDALETPVKPLKIPPI